ncbi:MAG: HAMP domain-containing protein, partial [Gammaproteobacteria bacterium]|nr:HAMP domain-containing protein [Gammaproteobacteria bacterium]
MPEEQAETALPRTPPPAQAARRLWPWGGQPRLGIGWRLILGLTAVAAVLIAGEVLATRTTREALDAVRSMQNEHEPLASAANQVLEKLAAYDRAVDEYVQARSAADFGAINTAAAALENAVGAYYRLAFPASVSPAAAGLRVQLTRHITVARQLASRAAQRLQWVDERQGALTRVYERIAAAGGSGLAINGTQVVARRSLSELESAINSVRGNFDTPAVIARRERDFMTVLDAHAAEFENSPGRAWLSLVRHDFQAAARLRLQIDRYDEQSGAEWHSLLEDSAALTEGVQEQLQRPARAGLLRAAQHAATAAEGAEHTLRDTGAAVLLLLAVVSVLLVGSISLPVRRLAAATRQFAGGDRAARARRGGSAEIDELAESFNTMADRIASAESELRAHQ